MAGPGAGRAGLGAGAPSPGAGPGSPEQDLQRRTALRRAEDRLRAAGARPGLVGCRRDPRGAAGCAPTPGPPHSPWPRAGGEVAEPVEGGGAVRAPQRVRAVPAHSAPRAGRRALRGGRRRDVTAAGKGALRVPHPPPPFRGPRRGWAAGWGAPRGVVGVPAPEGGALPLWAAARRSQVPPPRSSLEGLGPLPGCRGLRNGTLQKRHAEPGTTYTGTRQNAIPAPFTVQPLLGQGVSGTIRMPRP